MLYRASTVEIIVPYGDPRECALLTASLTSTTASVGLMQMTRSEKQLMAAFFLAGAPFNRKCAFDAMDYGLGVSANSLELVSFVHDMYGACSFRAATAEPVNSVQ